MQNKPSRYQQLIQALNSLVYDPNGSWQDYPCLDLGFPKNGSGKRYSRIKDPLTSRAKNPSSKKDVETHILAWRHLHGEVPSGFMIRRHCGNGGCFHPMHMFLKEKVGGLKWLTETVLTLRDDPSAPWSDYPCLLWPGADSKSRHYPTVWVPRDPSRPFRTRVNAWAARASRIAYEIANGKITNDLVVCHFCDVPSCFRPSHLWVGTAKENVGDMIAKKRAPSGERHGMAKISTIGVIDIRARIASGESKKLLAAEYGLSWFTINDIVKGKTWKHVKD